MKYKDFYAEVGKLLYAVAMANGKIHKAEEQALHNLVKKRLVPAEKHVDEFGTDTAYYAEIEFDFLVEKLADPEVAYNSFLNYVSIHHTAIGEPMMNRLIQVSIELAASYHGITTSERTLLHKLIQDLQQVTESV